MEKSRLSRNLAATPEGRTFMTMADVLVGLNEEQRRVVETIHGPVLVLAGAGSGKTRALTHRIAHLIRGRFAQPEEILAVTFTNKAAREMKDRVTRLLTGQHRPPAALGTFHSIGARMVRDYAAAVGRSRGFSILDEQDSSRVVKQAMDRVGVGRRYSSASVRTIISRAKNEGTVPQEEQLAAVYQEYQRWLAIHDACDFDDLLVLPVQLLTEHEQIRRRFQERWRFLSVDEYQDTNALQVKFLELLLGPERNICVVGDDYQAIYSWRGARIDHIRDFPQTFPGSTVLTLTQNYRSTPEVLESANALMAPQSPAQGRAAGQAEKQLWTRRQSGSPVQLVHLPSDRSEARYVRERIQAHVSQGGSLSDCAVLYRTNAQSRLLEEEFLTHEVPYTIVGGFRFYERREVKDALALLQLSQNGRAGVAAARIAAALWRGIGPKTLASWQARAEAQRRDVWEEIREEAQRRPTMQKAVWAIAAGQTQPFATVADNLRFLLTQSGYRAWLSAQPDSEERKENIEELLNVASVYHTSEEFLEAVALLTDLDHHDQKTANRVVCMTLHAAKGLEFPLVFITGCEEGLLPHLNSLSSPEQLEEERRLFYVGMTRAKDTLVLSYVHRRLLHGSLTVTIPSRFLSGLPESVERVTPDSLRKASFSEELIDYALPL